MKLNNATTIFTALGVASLFNLMSIANKAEASPIKLFGLTTDSNLVTFDPTNPTVVNNIDVTGITGNLVGIDFRPANGDLFGVTDSNQIYSIDPVTGAGTLASDSPDPFTLNGTSFGVDFNPIPDRIRVVSNTGQNLRLNQNTGGLGVTDGQLAYNSSDPNFGTAPDIVAAAYINSKVSPTPPATTKLYGIDRTLDILVIQDPPNDGVLSTVGPLGVDFGDGGFDIVGSNGQNLGYAVSDSTLYSINLSSGAATSLGTIGDGSDSFTSLSGQVIPEPSTVASLSGLGAFALFKISRGRRRTKLNK